MNLAELRSLLSRVEAATEPDRQLDACIEVTLDIRPDWALGNSRKLVVTPGFGGWSGSLGHVSLGKHGPGWGSAPYTASIDAAAALVGRVLPGWDWVLERDGAKMGDVVYFASVHEVRPDFLARVRMETHDSAPLALCAALLRALIAREDPLPSPSDRGTA